MNNHFTYQNTVLTGSQHKSLVISGSLYWKNKNKNNVEHNYVSALEEHLSRFRDQPLCIVTGWVTCYQGQKIVNISFSNRMFRPLQKAQLFHKRMTIKILNHG